MLGIVAPASDAIFKVPNEAPQNDGEWQAPRNSALILAETGNYVAWTRQGQKRVDEERQGVSRRRISSVRSGQRQGC